MAKVESVTVGLKGHRTGFVHQMTPDAFLEAVGKGLRDCKDVVVTGSLTLEGLNLDPPLDLSGLLVDGNLTIRNCSGILVRELGIMNGGLQVTNSR